MARLRRSREELKAVDAQLERLRDFIRRNYLTAAEVARPIGVRDATIYDWLLGRTRPAEPQRVSAFLDSLTEAKKAGIAESLAPRRLWRSFCWRSSTRAF